MDKNAIKKYAIWARRELIERVSQRALIYGVSADGQADAGAVLVNGQALNSTEQNQRKALIMQIREKGYEQVMEEVAYTWFNRFAALRFMEVNGYLPSHIRVFTDDNGAFKPQILTEAIHLELDGLDMEKVYALERENKKEELFKYLLIVQCNALSSILPGMFQKIEDYTELLLPDYLLREGSVIEQMVTTIPEEDWTDQVQIIGWLYQYYNTEPKDQVFADLKKNIKISKEKIPAATQLFTPDWIVHYMVENSLGRLWIEKKRDSGDLASPIRGSACEAGEGVSPEKHFADNMGWKYYLEEAPQEPEVEAQLAEIRKEYAALKPEEILCIDPCMGSGHILCVLFDVLVKIYEDYGYTAREAAVSIIQNNLWGLDIDDRAAQLAYFAVMMKARQYDRRFFSRGIQPHVYAIAESNHVSNEAVEYFGNGDEKLTEAMQTIITELHDAKEYGSILMTTEQDWDALYARFDEIRNDISIYKDAALALEPLVQTAQALGQKYHVTVTNPPYAASANLNPRIADFTKKSYPDSKSDLFSVFIERAYVFVKPDGYTSLITMESWMFLSSFEKLRIKINTGKTIINMVHMPYLGKGGTSLGINFGTAAVITKNLRIANYNAQYEYTVYYECDEEGVPIEFPTFNKRWKSAKQENFSKIPGSPVAYWVSETLMKAFSRGEFIGDICEPRVGMATANNDMFIRLWYEVEIDKIGFCCRNRLEAQKSKRKWFPFTKGGEFRKWYGNNDYVVNWENDGYEIQNFRDEDTGRIRSHNYNLDYIFQSALTWTVISSANTSFRFCPVGFLYSNSGYGIFFKNENHKREILGLLNTKVVSKVLNILSPTIGFEAGYLKKIPYLAGEKAIEDIVFECIRLSTVDWDMFETSWDFKRHPLLSVIPRNRMLFDDIGNIDLAECYMCWSDECEERFQTLKANEEELNRIFIDIYGLQDELTPEVADKDVTVRRFFDTKDDIPESMRGSAYALTKQDAIKSLISYAVGCMFGRYSIYKEGLLFAGESYSPAALEDKLNENVRQSAVEKHLGIEPQRIKLQNDMFLPDSDAIIPICDDEYFTDDIVGLFVKFIEIVYGANSLEENLRFIADALGTKGSTSREIIRNYFLNGFYKDHCKTYQKRPIYWLFDSGKKNGFKCLIYMHRYQPDTIARIRTDYVHEQQSRYRTAIADLEQRINGAAASDRVKLNKQLQKLQGQSEEVRIYEEKIHHLADQFIPIDLDDGVKVNYVKFRDVLAKIR